MGSFPEGFHVVHAEARVLFKTVEEAPLLRTE